jgi:UDP:flavonoid glycosyltransferase YjiC (YdhE family)
MPTRAVGRCCPGAGGYGRASKMRLNGVSAARRKRVKPASVTSCLIAASPACWQLAACDLAVVQGGLTTTMELTAARRPFIYVPLGHHFEQNFHVRHRLDRYRAGRCLEYQDTGPESLAQAMAAEIGRPVSYRPVETDGAARAAAYLAELI